MVQDPSNARKIDASKTEEFVPPAELPSWQFEIQMQDNVSPPVGSFVALIDQNGDRTIVEVLGTREQNGKTILLVKRKMD